MRKLLTALLVLPFLLGANAGAFAPESAGDVQAVANAASPHALSGLALTAPQPTLPAHLTAAGVLAGGALVDAGGASDRRASTRSGRHGPDLLHGHEDAGSTCTRLALLHDRELRFRGALAQAHAGLPVTYGNPPPASLT